MNQNEAMVVIASGLGCSFEKVRQACQQLEQAMRTTSVQLYELNTFHNDYVLPKNPTSNEWYRKFDKRPRKNNVKLYNYRPRRM